MSTHRSVCEYQPLPGPVSLVSGRRWAVGLVTLMAIGTLARTSVAQDIPEVHPGSRVRLTLEGARSPTVTGRLIALGPDSVTIAGDKDGDSKIVLRSTVTRVDLSLRRETQVGRGLALGAVAGALVGGVTILAVAMAAPPCDDPNNHGFFCADITTGNALKGLGIAIASGAATGFSLAARRLRDVWTPARWSDGVAPIGRSPKPLPLLGLAFAEGHPVLRLGVTLAH